MRPVRLQFSGLHSYRDRQDIDFTALSGLGLFGIFGPTGSGKSTILDAITLALYGRVERAGGRTHGILNQAESRLSVAFTFEIASGSERRKYRVERTYTRSGPDTASHERSLLVEERPGLPDLPLADRKQEVDDRIIRLIGLKIEDFTRAVVLPQGRFAEFLQLDGAPRRKMLERLFNLEQYGEMLLQRVRQSSAESNQALARVEAEQTGLGDASPEACEKAARDLQASRDALASADAQARLAESQYRDGKRVWELQHELDAVLARRDSLLARSGQMSAMQEEMEAAGRAERVRLVITAFETSARSLNSAERDLQGQLELLEQILEDLKQAHARAEEAEATRRQREPVLRQRQFQLEQAQGLEAECAALAEQLTQILATTAAMDEVISRDSDALKEAEARLTQKRDAQRAAETEYASLEVSPSFRTLIEQSVRALKEYRRLAGEVDLAEKDLRQKEVSCEQSLREYSSGQQALAGVEKQLDLQRTVFEQLGSQQTDTPESVHEGFLDLERLTRVVSELADHRGRLEDVLAQRQAGAVAAQAISAQIEQSRVYSEHLDRQISSQRQDLETARKNLRQISSVMQASLLSRDLAPGVPCPVCGSTEHPVPACAVDEGAIAIAEAEVSLLEAAVQQSLAGRAAADASIASLKAKHEFAQGELARLDGEFAKIQDHIGECLMRLPAGWPETQAEIEVRLRAYRDELLNRREQATGHAQRVSAASESLLALEREAAARQAAVARLEAVVDGLVQRVAEAREAAERAKAGAATALLYLDEVRGDVAVEDMEAHAAGIQQKDVRRHSVEESRARLAREIEDLWALVRRLEAELNAKREVRARNGDEADRLRKEVSRLEQKIGAVTGGQPSQVLVSQVEHEFRAITGACKDALDRLESCRSRHQAAAQSVAAAEGRCNELRAASAAVAAELADAVARAGFGDRRSAEAALRSEEQRATLSSALNTYRSQKEQALADVTRVTAELGGRSLNAEEWANLSVQLEAARDALSAASRQVGAFERALDQVLARRNRWQELESTRAQHAGRSALLRQLESALRGNAFVDFVAEEQLVAIALDASQRLGALTRYRYALLVNSDGGFVIRDDHNGGVQRPVSSLSGGETFLTSLALALALSSQIQLRGESPLEFFFLDEGFGTLDPDTLDVVLDSLDRLRNDRMTIGVISHVPEFRSRISRKIIVEPAQPGGGSSLRVEVG